MGSSGAANTSKLVLGSSEFALMPKQCPGSSEGRHSSLPLLLLPPGPGTLGSRLSTAPPSPPSSNCRVSCLHTGLLGAIPPFPFIRLTFRDLHVYAWLPTLVFFPTVTSPCLPPAAEALCFYLVRVLLHSVWSVSPNLSVLKVWLESSIMVSQSAFIKFFWCVKHSWYPNWKWLHLLIWMYPPLY